MTLDGTAWTGPPVDKTANVVDFDLELSDTATFVSPKERWNLTLWHVCEGEGETDFECVLDRDTLTRLMHLLQSELT